MLRRKQLRHMPSYGDRDDVPLQNQAKAKVSSVNFSYVCYIKEFNILSIMTNIFTFTFLLMQCTQSNNSHSVTRQISRCRSSGDWRRKIFTGHGIQNWPDKQNTGAFQTSN